MAKHKPVLVEKNIQGVDVEGKELTVKQSLPAQMSLFQTFFNGEEAEQSNTIELFDAIPLYTNSRTVARMRENGKYLPTMKRSFRYRDGEYDLTLFPARVMAKDGSEKEYYRVLPNKGTKRDIGIAETPFCSCIYGDFSTPKFHGLLSSHF